MAPPERRRRDGNITASLLDHKITDIQGAMPQTRRTCLCWIVGGMAAAAAPSFGASAQETRPRTIRIDIRKRKIVAPKGRIRIYESESVELLWTTDETVSLHLHGYDKEFLVEPGTATVLPITGRATGRFPISSHRWGSGGGAGGHGHHALTYLEVYPR